MVLVVVLVHGKQPLWIVDVIKVQDPGRSRWFMKIGFVFLFYAVYGVEVGAVPAVMAGGTGGMLVDQPGLDDMVPAFGDVPFALPA